MNDPSPTMLLRQVAAIPALRLAWRKVRANCGAAGIDTVSIGAFEKRLPHNLAELSRNLLSGAYEPLPARFVTILKANGKERELGILAVRDRVAQRAVLDAIEPLFEPKFADCSYAFRPGRSVEMAVQRVLLARANGFRWTVESDVENFFSTLNRRLLFLEVEREMNDTGILRLLGQWLDAATFDTAPLSPGTLTRAATVVRQLVSSARDSAWRILDDRASDRGNLMSDLPMANAATVHFDDLARENQTTDWAADELPEIPPAPAWKKLLRDAALMAFAERALLKKALSRQALGIGGMALAAALIAPAVKRAWRDAGNDLRGTLQGAPISPLLSNIYLHPFDTRLTQTGFRLVRYCDDFVLLCNSEAEAKRALMAAEQAVNERQLRLHPEKTRILSPGEPFDFLGYRFHAAGGASKIPSPTKEVLRHSAEVMREQIHQRTQQLQKQTTKTRMGIANFLKKAVERLKRNAK